MCTVIADIPVVAIAYAWSQEGVTCFISTCGKTMPLPTKYRAKFKDEWGNTSFQAIPRPDILHFVYEYLPHIHEHNKVRQSLHALEKHWLTKNCSWFCLITTIVGICVVNIYCLYHYHQLKMWEKHRMAFTSFKSCNLLILFVAIYVCGNTNSGK
jgi:hypothetical protein